VVRLRDAAPAVESAPGCFAPLDGACGETYLFHGTNTRASLKIASEDVSLNFASTGGGLGPGLYLSESATKSDEYASDSARPGCDEADEYYGGIFAMLLMRVALGEVLVTDKFFSDDEKVQLRQGIVTERLFDSVLADRRKSVGTYREFCVFDSRQIYTEYVILYERVYADPSFGVPRIWASHPRQQRDVLHFQVPSYWVNFHKNPDREPFDEEYPLRPRAFDLIQYVLRLITGSEHLCLLQASRYESSAMLQEYVALKLAVRARGVSRPKLASELVLSGRQFRSLISAGFKSAWSRENIEEDINETYLWAMVPTTTAGSPLDVRSAAAVVRGGGALFGNPADALHGSLSCGSCQALLLCRVVCGEMHVSPDESPGAAQAAAANSVVTTHREPPPAAREYLAFRMLTGPCQIYPEMLVHVGISR